MKLTFIALCVIFASSAFATDLESITVYGHSNSRGPQAENPTVMDKLIKEFNTRHSAEYGFTVNYETKKAEITQAYQDGPAALAAADIVQIKDAINVGHARQHDFFVALNSPILEQNIPAHLRSEDGTWFAMSKRARAIYHHTSISPQEIQSYENLSNPKWEGRLCLRQSSKSYNKALVAFFMDQKGAEATFEMLSGWIANNPFITNTDMRSKVEGQFGTTQAIHEGKCQLGVANTYYLAFYEKLFPDEQLPISIFVPENAHINGVSYGVMNSSEKQAQAQAFLEWMSSAEAQEFDSANSNQFPTNPRAQLSTFLSRVGSLQDKENKSFNFETATDLKGRAFDLMLEAGWVDEPTSVSN